VTDQAPAPPQNEPYWKKVRREREEREARNNPAPKPEAGSEGPEDSWKIVSRKLLLNGKSHGQNQALQEIYDKGVSRELQWMEVGSRMQAYLNTSNRLLSTSKF
jgi:hypothetical protein